MVKLEHRFGRRIASGARRVLSSACLALLAAGIRSAQADTYVDENELTWTFTTNTTSASISRVDDVRGAVVIPAALAGKPVTSFGTIFQGQANVVRVTIPEGVTAIADGAFKGCKNLKGVTIKSTVLTSIGYQAFMNCGNLESFVIPDSVTTLGQGVFSDCSALEEVSIGDGVVTLTGGTYKPNYNGCYGDYDSSTNLFGDYDRGLFYNCTSLKTINWGKDVKTIGNAAFLGCSALERVEIPDTVTTIGSHAFYWCERLGEVKIGAKVTTIGRMAFRADGNLTKVTFGNSVAEICQQAFQDCVNLQNFTLPTSIQYLRYRCFAGCSKAMTEVTIPTNRDELETELEQGVFAGCSKLETVTVGDTVKKLTGGTYKPNYNNCYGDYDSSTNLYGDYDRGVFYNCTSLKTINWGKGVKTIGSAAFLYCTALEKVALPASVDTIGCHAFYGCTKLTTVIAEGSINELGRRAFGNDPALRKVYFKGPVMDFEPGTDPFKFDSAELTVYAASGSTGWTGVAEVAGLPADGKWSGVSIAYGSPSEADYPHAAEEPPEEPPVEPPVTPVVESNVVVFVIGERGTLVGGALTQLVEKASAATAPEVEAKPGYRFAKWDTAFDSVEADLTVTAEYEILRYAITYEDVREAENGNPTAYTVEDEVVFAALADVEGFSFTGWSPTSIAKGTTGDRVVTALWEEVEEPEEPEEDDGVYLLEPRVAADPIAVDAEAMFGVAAGQVKSVAVKGLPSGLKYKDGEIAGTPTKSGVFMSTVTLTTKSGQKREKSLMFIVRTERENVAVGFCDATMGKVSGQGVYAAGKLVTLKATANKGYVFYGWYLDGEYVLDQATCSFKMPDGDAVLVAVFVTVEEDRAAISAQLGETGVGFTADVTTAATNVLAGVYLEWPVAVEALSDVTIKVSGLPSGLKFTAKAIVDRTTGSVTVSANTIYGTPTASSKSGKPSTVKIAVTTAGKTKQEFTLSLTVDDLPSWAVGTFNGGSAAGQATFTVAKTGKLSGKWLSGGLTWTLSASGFDGYLEATDEAAEALYAVMTAKSGSETSELLVVVTPEGLLGSEDGETVLFEAGTPVDWKSGERKALAAKMAKAPALSYTVGDDQPGTLTLTFAANGTVKVSGKFQTGEKNGKAVYATVTGTSALCPTGESDYRVYVYLPPKGAFVGCVGTIDLTWDGTAFVDAE